MDFLQSIKIATRDAHQEMEQSHLFHKIITKEITLAEYKNLLNILYGFIKPCETILSTKYPDLISGREKIPFLQLDLNENIDIPYCIDIPKFENKAHSYGYLYVMEGSTLGGQVISQCLKQNTNLPLSLNPQYFNPYGKQTKEKWIIFTQDLLKHTNSSDEKIDVIGNAIDTFTTLSKWLRVSTQE